MEIQMKKVLLLVLPALILGACEKHYTMDKDAFCTGVEETSEESVFCTNEHGKPISGIVTQYYENGKVFRQMTLKKGIENGIEKEYYENGQLKVKAKLKDGKPHGDGMLYYENGKIQMESKWKNGESVAIRLYDENGNVETEVGKF